MSTSQGAAGTKNCTRLDFYLVIQVKRREKNQKKSAGVNSRVSPKCTTIGVSVCRRERQARNWRFELQTEGTGGGVETRFQKTPRSFLHGYCCCCCPPVFFFVSGITEGVTLASLPPLSPCLSLAVCVYTLVSSTYLFSRSRVLSHPSPTATIKRRKRNKEKGNFFFFCRKDVRDLT